MVSSRTRAGCSCFNSDMGSVKQNCDEMWPLANPSPFLQLHDTCCPALLLHGADWPGCKRPGLLTRLARQRLHAPAREDHPCGVPWQRRELALSAPPTSCMRRHRVRRLAARRVAPRFVASARATRRPPPARLRRGLVRSSRARVPPPGSRPTVFLRSPSLPPWSSTPPAVPAKAIRYPFVG